MIITTAKEIGPLVREYRKRRGLTQARLAEMIRVSRRWVIDLEAGRPNAELSLVLRALRALGIELTAHDRNPLPPHTESTDLDAVVSGARAPRGRS